MTATVRERRKKVMREANFASRATALTVPTLAAVAFMAAGSWAVAEQVTEITVVAPRGIARVDTTSAGIPIDSLWITHRVGYADLDLSDPANIKELDKRVKEAAEKGCQELDRVYPDTVYPSFDSARTCVKIAVGNAMSQVDAAVAASQKK